MMQIFSESRHSHVTCYKRCAAIRKLTNDFLLQREDL